MTTKPFNIALSFRSEHRAFVERVARGFGSSVGAERVLYDRDYGAEFARPDLDTYLQHLLPRRVAPARRVHLHELRA